MQIDDHLPQTRLLLAIAHDFTLKTAATFLQYRAGLDQRGKSFFLDKSSHAYDSRWSFGGREKMKLVQIQPIVNPLHALRGRPIRLLQEISIVIKDIDYKEPYFCRAYI